MGRHQRVLGYIFLGILGLSVAACRSAQPVFSDAAQEEAAIRAVMAAQVDAWNRGDLEGFMGGYVRSDTLRFASGGHARRGWQTALDAHLAGYPDRAAMGTLVFDVRDVQLLSPPWALVFGEWRLRRANDEPWGLYTLLFRKTEAGWQIVHDHTSSGE